MYSCDRHFQFVKMLFIINNVCLLVEQRCIMSIKTSILNKTLIQGFWMMHPFQKKPESAKHYLGGSRRVIPEHFLRPIQFLFNCFPRWKKSFCVLHDTLRSGRTIYCTGCILIVMNAKWTHHSLMKASLSSSTAAALIWPTCLTMPLAWSCKWEVRTIRANMTTS